MWRAFVLLAAAALTLAGCNLPDIDPGAIMPASNSHSAQQETALPAPGSPAGQAPENTGDYANYM